MGPLEGDQHTTPRMASHRSLCLEVRSLAINFGVEVQVVPIGRSERSMSSSQKILILVASLGIMRSCMSS